MDDLQRRIDDLAELMDEFNLEKAELKGEDWLVGFDRNAPTNGHAAPSAPQQFNSVLPKPKKKRAAVPAGTPCWPP